MTSQHNRAGRYLRLFVILVQKGVQTRSLICWPKYLGTVLIPLFDQSFQDTTNVAPRLFVCTFVRPSRLPKTINFAKEGLYSLYTQMCRNFLLPPPPPLFLNRIQKVRCKTKELIIFVLMAIFSFFVAFQYLKTNLIFFKS